MSIFKIIVSFLLLSGSVLNSHQPTSALKELSQGFSSIAKKAMPSTVSINGVPSYPRYKKNIHKQDPGSFFSDDFFSYFFSHKPPAPIKVPSEKTLLGSGFVIRSDGYVVTNSHVIDNHEQFTIKFNSAKEYPAKLIGKDPSTDLAVLKIEEDNLPSLSFGDSDVLDIGEWVIAIGNPFKLEGTLTVGVVSAKGRKGFSEPKQGISAIEDFIQTDAAINPGNSGGPLLNLNGDVIGINSALLSLSGGYMGLSLSIPSNLAKNVTTQLIKNGKVSRGFLGVLMQSLTGDLSKTLALDSKQGILIVGVNPDSPALKAGIQAGDVITAVNERAIKNIHEFVNTIALILPGTEITLTFIRDGKQAKLPITVTHRPDNVALSLDPLSKFGFEVRNIDTHFNNTLGYQHEKGVIVTKVLRDSPAFRAGLSPRTRILSVNKQPINNVKDFYEMLNSIEGKSSILLLIENNQRTFFVTMNVK